MLSAKKELFTPSGGGYQISRSVRLRNSASGYFGRTPASAGSRTTWTWSGWVKRGDLSRMQGLFGAGVLGNNANFQVYWNSNNTIYFQETVQNVSNQMIWSSTPVYRDSSAWYHVVIAMDTTQATAANRAKVYVNGVEISGAFSVTPAQNQATSINNNVAHYLGAAPTNTASLLYMDGYQTEVNFIDGQALTPSSFGETNAITGVWQPKRYAGTYGTNGFYLNFSDNSGVTATTIGKDYSGNGNNWTPNNISVTAGTTYDSMIDVPTLYADGGNGRGNYAVLNPLWVGSGITTSNANLTATASSSANSLALGTIAVSSGKWYWESTIVSGSSMWAGGVVNPSIATPNYTSLTTGNSYAYNNASTSYNGQTGTTYGATYTTNDVIGTALDLDTGAITFYKNGVSQGVAYTGISGTFTPMVLLNTSSISINFGQRPFAYTPPTGFVALNTQNLSTPTISNGASYMAATTYTGNGTTQSITNTVNGVSFQPDMVWAKNRTTAGSNHRAFDSVRGASQILYPSLTNAEATDATGLTSFNSNGFSVGATSINDSAANFVAWQWNAGGSTVTNTSGTISSQVRANATAGFSVVTYTGNGTSGATVGHGLGVVPAMMIVKNRSSGTEPWRIYHKNMAASPATVAMNFDTGAASVSSTRWNNTVPTSSVFTIGNDASVNANTNNYIAYCFAAVAGYSAFGSYTGNGSADGVFVYLGFRARFLMIKRTDSTGGWVMLDTARDTYNDVDNYLYANSSAADAGSSNVLDINSNGFKIRNSWTDINASGGTYIYMAFAENPFKLSLAR